MNKFKKFRIEDVLQWQSQKEIDPLKLDELTISKDKIYPFYGQATLNNGIISYNHLKEDVLNNKDAKPTILIHSNNQNIVYLETPFYLKDGHGATSVLQAYYLNEKIALYIITSIKKVISKKFSYNEKATKIALKNTEIDLPVKTDNTIDFEYMEKYISELEEERISELEEERISELNTYLKISGLDNYELSGDENQIIKKHFNNNIKYENYKISDLFASENGNFDIQKKHINNKGVYVVSSGELNNGIIGKSDILAKVFQEDTITVDMFGNAYFRDYKYKMVTHARVFNLTYKEKKLTKEEGLYFVSLFKYFKDVFSYSDMASWNKIKDIEILIPIKEDKTINYDFMNTFIKAQEKLAIRDVILWKDRIIDETNKLVTN